MTWRKIGGRVSIETSCPRAGQHHAGRDARPFDQARPAPGRHHHRAGRQRLAVQLDAHRGPFFDQHPPHVTPGLEARAGAGRRLREGPGQLAGHHLRVVREGPAPRLAGPSAGSRARAALAREALDAQAARQLPGAPRAEIALARLVERHRQHARAVVADVDARQIAQLGRQRRIERPALEPQIQQRARPFRLHLRAQDAGGGAGGLGARDPALDHRHADPALREAQRHGRAHDSTTDDRDVAHPVQIPSVGAPRRCSLPSSDFDIQT